MEERREPPPESAHQRPWSPRDLRPFTGGPLVGASFELDAAYYGAVAVNRATVTEHAVRTLVAVLVAWTTGRQTEDLIRPRPQLEDTTSWMELLRTLDPQGLATQTDQEGRPIPWENALLWRLDVLRAVSELPRSRQRAFCLAAEGYDRRELAALLPPEDGEPWDAASVRTALKQVSRHVRRRTELQVPPTGASASSGATPTAAARVTEREWRRQVALGPRYRARLEAGRQERFRQRRAERQRELRESPPESLEARIRHHENQVVAARMYADAGYEGYHQKQARALRRELRRRHQAAPA